MTKGFGAVYPSKGAKIEKNTVVTPLGLFADKIAEPKGFMIDQFPRVGLRVRESGCGCDGMGHFLGGSVTDNRGYQVYNRGDWGRGQIIGGVVITNAAYHLPLLKRKLEDEDIPPTSNRFSSAD